MTAAEIRTAINRFCEENKTEILWQTKNLSPLMARGIMPHDAFIDMLAQLFAAEKSVPRDSK